MILDEVMLNLRKKEGIKLSSFKNKYKYSFSELFKIDELLIDNLLIKTKTNIFIPEDKMFVSNEIIIRLFDNYLGICQNILLVMEDFYMENKLITIFESNITLIDYCEKNNIDIKKAKKIME